MVLEEMVLRANRETINAGRVMIVVGKHRTKRDNNAITTLKLPGTMLIKNTMHASRNEVQRSKHAMVRVHLFNKCIKCSSCIIRRAIVLLYFILSQLSF